MKKEIRLLDVAFTVEDKSGTAVFTGKPIVYNRNSDDLGFIERISPGAATDAIKRSDIRLAYGHNTETLLPLARTASGTMTVVDGPDGVSIEASAPNTQFAKDLAESIRRGDVSQMSFAFTVADGGDFWEKRDGKHFRTITKLDEIYDFSFVAYPAYPDTTAAMRSLDKAKTSATAGAGDATVAENEDIDMQLLLQNYEV